MALMAGRPQVYENILLCWNTLSGFRATFGFYKHWQRGNSIWLDIWIRYNFLSDRCSIDNYRITCKKAK